MQGIETVAVQDSSCDDYIPSSMSLMESSQYSQAFFHDLYELYPTDCDLRCRYSLSESVKYTHGDRIGLFKVGWKYVTDFVQFKLAPIPLSEKENLTLRVTFSANLLPKEENELYQLCYITKDNKVIGASVPFGFRRPDQSDLVDVEDRNDPGLTVYKSRIAVLHDRIARLEDDKETAELKCHMMTDRITILEKELSSVSSSNKTLTKSLDEANQEVSVLKDKLAAAESMCCDLKTNLSDLQSKCTKLTSELVSATEEKNLASFELNAAKQGHVHAELLLKEVSDYNAKLKTEVDSLKEKNGLLMEHEQTDHLLKVARECNAKLKAEVDGLKERNGLLMANENVQKHLVSELKLDCKKLKEENERLTLVSKSKQEVPLRQVENRAMDFIPLEDTPLLQLQLNQALELLEETLQNQSSDGDKHTKLNQDVKRLSQMNAEFETRIANLTDTVKCKDEEIRKLKSENFSVCEKNNDTSLVLEELRINAVNYEREIGSLREKLNEKEVKIDRKTEGKIKELEELVESLKQVIANEPKFAEFCYIFMESSRVTAMNSYKDLYNSLQFIHFENAEIGMRVRRLLDEFGVLKQDLDRCRQELHDKVQEQELSKAELQRVNAANEFHEQKVVELNETVNELRNCLGAVKKDCDETDLEKLKSEIAEMKTKSEDLEQQLKEVKVANALTNIGQTTVGHASLMAEINRLRNKLLESQSQQSVSKDCCREMQDRLQQSAKEYAKLYRQLIQERIQRNVQSPKQSAGVVPVLPEALGLQTTSSSSDVSTCSS